MKKPIVLCTENEYIVSTETRQFLSEHVDLVTFDVKPSHKQLYEQIGDAEGLLCTGYRIDATLLDAAPKLRVVSTASVGYDQFDVTEMKKRGLIGLHTPKVLNVTVADLIIALMFAVSRRVCELDKLIRQGDWPQTTPHHLFGLELSNKKLGIIGMGRIGETLAQKLIAGFNMQVRYYNRQRKIEFEEQSGAQYAPLEQVLAESDYIVVMTPLTDETRGLIGKKEFSMMKKTAIFINASRGPVIDEKALVHALESKTIYGAGLDVYEKEPIDSDNPLAKLSNAVLVPHIGSATRECRDAMGRLAAQGIVEFFSGKTPENIIPFFVKNL